MNLIGHKNLRAKFTKLVDEGKFPQTSLFYGPDGCGKRQVAYELAQTLLVHDDNTRALFEKGNHPDFHVIEPTAAKTTTKKSSKSKGSIKTEQIQELKKKLAYPPLLGETQVVVIDDADLMTTVTANSLLKLLEEPRPHQIFILVTASLHKILITIRSRAAKFHFSGLKPEEVKQIVKDESEETPDPQFLNLLVESFPGSPALILKGLEMDLNAQDVDQFLSGSSGFIKNRQKIQGLLKGDVDLKIFLQLLRHQALKRPDEVDRDFFDRIRAAETQLQKHIQEEFVLENLFLS